MNVSEEEVINMVRELSIEAKKEILKSLIVSDIDRFEALVDYGEDRLKERCKERGVDYRKLSGEQKEQFVDEILHED